MAYQETVVRRDQHRIHVRDHPGAGPPIILMHGRFFRDADVRREFVPLLYQQFDATPSALPAFSQLLPMVRSRTAMIPKLREFRRPVRIIFGAAGSLPESGCRPDVP